jgi:hypothetical protein
MRHKLLLPFLAVALLSTSGCISNAVHAKAQGAVNRRSADQVRPGDGEPKPAYYALLPLTIPLDIGLSPIELLLWATGSIPSTP